MYFDNTWLTYFLILTIIASLIFLFVNIMYTHFVNREYTTLKTLQYEAEDELTYLKTDRDHLRSLQRTYQEKIEAIVFSE